MINTIMEVYLFIKNEILEFINWYSNYKKKNKKEHEIPANVTGNVSKLVDADSMEEEQKELACKRLEVIENYKLGKFDSCFKYISKHEDKPVLFFMDDIIGTNILYDSDIRKINNKFNKDIKSDFSVAYCFGETCAESGLKELRDNKIKVDYAILDITIKTIFRVDENTAIEVDGIDIALLILKDNPDAKILFSTAHTMDRRNKSMSKYIDKYEYNTGEDIMDHYLNKNATDRTGVICKFLYMLGK